MRFWHEADTVAWGGTLKSGLLRRRGKWGRDEISYVCMRRGMRTGRSMPGAVEVERSADVPSIESPGR